MTGKYHTLRAYSLAKLRRNLLKPLLRPLVSWQGLTNPVDGYTVIIGSLASLPELLLANLKVLSRLDRTHLHQIIVVCDGVANVSLERLVAELPGRLPCVFLYYSAVDRFVTRTIRWPWINSWLSWTKGISRTRTKYAILHDLDAMPLDPKFIEARYRQIRTKPCEYLGARWYSGQGILAEDRLATTFELFFDVEFVRRHFSPLELFNHVATFKGRMIEFDTFLFAQSLKGRIDILPTDIDSLVHPSQMICQYAFHLCGDRRLPRSTNNLLLIPYFMSLGGNESVMLEMEKDIRLGCRPVNMFGKPVDVGMLTEVHTAWIIKQARHLELALFGEMRPQVASYLNAIGRCECKKVCS